MSSTSVGDIIAHLGIHSSIKGDMAKAQMQLNSSLDGMSTRTQSTMSKIGKTVAVAGVAGVAAAGLIAAKSAKTFMNFEQTVANTASVTGLTGQAFEDAKTQIADVSKELGANTVFKATEAADAMYNLASAGIDVADMTSETLKPILDIAAGTGSDLTSATEIMTATMGQFGLTMEDNEQIADVFAKTIGSSQADITKLGNSLSYVGPVANGLGMSLEDTNAALGVLYNSGLDGSTAGTALRGALSRLANPTSEATDRLAALGITADQVNPATNEFSDILDILGEAGMSTADAMEIFGDRAGPAMLSLVGKRDQVDELADSLENAGGAAATMAEQQLDTMEGALKLLGSAIESVELEIGGALAPAIRAFAEGLTAAIPVIKDFITGVISWFQDLGTKLGPTFENLKSIAGSLAGILGDLFGDDPDAGATLASAIAGSLEAITGAVAGLLKFMDDHPTLTKTALAIIGVLAAIAAIPAAVGMITGAVASVIATVAGIGGAISAGLGIIGAIITAVGAPILIIIGVLAALYLAWTRDWGGLQTKTRAAAAAIKTTVGRITGYIKAFVDKAGDKLLFFLGPVGALIWAFRHWDEIPGIIKGAMGTAADYATAAGTAILDIILWIPRKIRDLGGEFAGAGRAIMAALYNAVTGKLSATATKVKEGLGEIRDLLPHSPAKAGPFRTLPDWDTALAGPIEESIKNTEKLTPKLESTLQDMRRSTPSAAQGTNSLVDELSVGYSGKARGGPLRPLLEQMLAAIQAGALGKIEINDVTLSPAYDYNDMMNDIEARMRQRRSQRGIRP